MSVTTGFTRKSLWTRIQEAAPSQGVTITQESHDDGRIAYRIVNNETGTDYGLFTPGETATTLGLEVLA